jgi:hypothetical protein
MTQVPREEDTGFSPDWSRTTYQIHRFQQIGPNKPPLREVLEMLRELGAK